MVDAKAAVRKVQDEPGTSHCVNQQGSALKMVEKLKKKKQSRQVEETPNRPTEENWNIKINNNSNTL